MTFCKHGVEKISCLLCWEERNAEAIQILIYRKEQKKQLGIKWKKKRRKKEKTENQ